MDELLILQTQMLRVQYVFGLMRDLAAETDHSHAWQWSDLPEVVGPVLAAKDSAHLAIKDRIVFWTLFWAQLQTCESEEPDAVLDLVQTAHGAASGSVRAPQRLLENKCDEDNADSGEALNENQEADLQFNPATIALSHFKAGLCKAPEELDPAADSMFKALQLQAHLGLAALEIASTQNVGPVGNLYRKTSVDDDAGGMIFIRKVTKEMKLPFWGGNPVLHPD